MQSLFLLIALFVVFVVVSTVLALVAAAVATLVTAAAIALPIYLVWKLWLSDRSSKQLRQNPVERLQNLYVDGQIDLFEYERRVARYIAVEH